MSKSQQSCHPISLIPGAMHTSLGTVNIRPVQPTKDAKTLHTWVTHPRSHFWGALDASEQEILAEYRRIETSNAEQAWLLYLDGNPIALSETYDPKHVVLNTCSEFTLHEGDIGMHILVSPPIGKSIHGLTDNIFSALVRWIFSHGEVNRIVVEPDVSNLGIHRKNARTGFTQPGLTTTLTMSGKPKTALIQYCTRPDFLGSPNAPLSYPIAPTPWELVKPTDSSSPVTLGIGHLAKTADAAHRELFAKALREFTHERLISPRKIKGSADETESNDGNHSGWRSYQVSWGSRKLIFRAREHRLLHLSVDPLSIHDPADLTWTPDIVTGIADAAEQLGIAKSSRETYLEEISATFAARARTLSIPRPTSTELADATRDPAELFQAIESAMVIGHPGFLANSGRGGMGETQLRAFSPELSSTTDLVWCAVDKNYAHLATIEYERAQESGSSHSSNEAILTLVPDFKDRCRLAGLNPDDYIPLPVHPWQWEQRFTTTFSADLAAGRIVPLGREGEAYRPQQSLRTFFNTSTPAAPYVKTAVAVRNMGFTRGLSAHYMESTPRVNLWLLNLIGDDPEFFQSGIGFLPEIASVGYTGSVYHRVTNDGSHTKMTAALWRQSPFSPETTPALDDGDTLSTLAGILHSDDEGLPLISAWINQSGLSAVDWINQLLTLYVRPLIHALVRYGIVFMPHTENVILRLNQNKPVGIYHKDLGEEIAVVSNETPVPSGLERLRARCGSDSPEDLSQQALSIHTDVIDGVLRHLAALLDDHAILEEDVFWEQLRHVASVYAKDHPELTTGDSRQARLWQALLAPRFRHSTLNRLQLRNPHTMVTLGDQDSSLIYAGELENPLHGV